MDVIAAIATGASPTAIGIVRVSGDGCFALCDRVFRAVNGRPFHDQKARNMAFGDMLDAQGRCIDHGLAVRFPAPHSYTGEDSAEFHCHGSPVVLRELLSALFAAGARQAGPGEFTKRAFLNGRLDLTEAEAVVDLIGSETAAAARNAAAQLSGSLRRDFQAVTDTLLDITTRFYAVVDYPDEDIPDIHPEEVSAALTAAGDTLRRLLATCGRGRVLKNGVATAIIGRPNAGKSSLTNRILGEQRTIVSNVAGTTRDAIDSVFENETGKYVFIDTAGMRKKAKVDESIERYSVLRAQMAIERSDVCLILIDATDGVTEQDTKVAGMAHEAGKASIIVVNKWDLVEKDGKTMDKMRQDVRRDLSFMTYAPILFISAATGQRVDRLFELIQYVNNQASTRITTGMLNSVLADAQTRVQPPTDKGRRLKIYYMTQTGIKPPHFVCFCNDARLFHFSYQRYLENQIRGVFGLEGTPIRMTIRQKGDKED